MRSINIITWGVSLLVLIPSLLGYLYPIELQYLLFITLSVVLGISHGAVDHLVSKYILWKQEEISLPKFITAYVFIAVTYALLWIWAPLLSFIILLLFSAYHFGQAELQEYLPADSTIHRSFTYMIWGSTMVLGLLFGNWNETVTLLMENTVIPLYTLEQLATSRNTLGKFIFASGFVTAVMLLRHFQADDLSQKWLAQSVGSLILLILLFTQVPFLISFSVFFGLWHSLKVLHHEYQGLYSEGAIHSVKSFITSLLPLSIISYLGLAAFTAIWYGFELNGPLHLYVIIFIASLALPHSLIMDRMYANMNKPLPSK